MPIHNVGQLADSSVAGNADREKTDAGGAGLLRESEWNGQGYGNPASFYCSQLGGAEIGATDFAGGAWVSKGGIDQLLEACIVPDNSTIDCRGLLYDSAGFIRGIDLAAVLKYPNPYPPK